MINPSRLSLALILAAIQASAAGSKSTTPKIEGLSGKAGVTGLSATPKLTGLSSMSLKPMVNMAELRLDAQRKFQQAQQAAIIPDTIANMHVAAMGGAIQGAVAQPMSVQAVVSGQMAGIQKALENDPSGGEGGLELDRLYFGRRHQRIDAVAVPNASRPERGNSKDPSKSAVFIVNDEGVEINGRAAVYYKEVRRLVNKYSGRIDMAESLDVMDDTYRAVQAKLNVIEAVAQANSIEDHNTHLEKTLYWVDGTMTDRSGRKIAVNTHQVYFHKASGPNKAASEIAEGNRRTDKYIEEMEAYFAPGGKAESALGSLDEVVLGFDTRGYAGIKEHLKRKEKELEARHGKKFRFVYYDDVMGKRLIGKEERAGEMTDENSRKELSRLIKKYKQHGLQKIVEGVIYSRYVGLLLELKTLEHYYERGYTILQAGHELFDKNGHYVTELDTVVRSPEGKVIIVEAKSARVSLEYDKALEDKVVRKLQTYIAHRDELEAMLGAKVDEVTFSVDVGREEGFKNYLEERREELSQRFGIPVNFLFLESGPEQAMQPGGPQGGKKKKKKGGR